MRHLRIKVSFSGIHIKWYTSIKRMDIIHLLCISNFYRQEKEKWVGVSGGEYMRSPKLHPA
jgi:hypothetical protein